jgi:hypothetical protein
MPWFEKQAGLGLKTEAAGATAEIDRVAAKVVVHAVEQCPDPAGQTVDQHQQALGWIPVSQGLFHHAGKIGAGIGQPRDVVDGHRVGQADNDVPPFVVLPVVNQLREHPAADGGGQPAQPAIEWLRTAIVRVTGEQDQGRGARGECGLRERNGRCR